jgi:hypothetical protein
VEPRWSFADAFDKYSWEMFWAADGVHVLECEPKQFDKIFTAAVESARAVTATAVESARASAVRSHTY